MRDGVADQERDDERAIAALADMLEDAAERLPKLRVMGEAEAE
jgi:hypothetical protein